MKSLRASTLRDTPPPACFALQLYVDLNHPFVEMNIRWQTEQGIGDDNPTLRVEETQQPVVAIRSGGASAHGKTFS